MVTCGSASTDKIKQFFFNKINCQAISAALSQLSPRAYNQQFMVFGLQFTRHCFYSFSESVSYKFLSIIHAIAVQYCTKCEAKC